MTMPVDYNEIAKFEKAIREKYGDDAIQDPRSLWNQKKEEKYLRDLKDFYTKEKVEKEILDRGSYLLKSTRPLKKQKSTCEVCAEYSTRSSDDLFFNRFQCCEKCYVYYVEGREERWKTGWRPNE